MRCVVVGAGIVGICCALALQRDGHEVVLVDRQEPAEGASKGNAGLFAYGHVTPLVTRDILRQLPRLVLDSNSPLSIGWSYLPRLAPWLWHGLKAASPARVTAISRALADLLSSAHASYEPLIAAAGASDLIRRRGYLMLFGSADTRRAANPDIALRRAYGVAMEELAEGDVRALVPGLRPGPLSGVLLSDCAHTTDPYRLTSAFANLFSRQGGQIIRADIRTARGEDGGARVVANGEMLAFDALVIAAGAWSRSLVRGLGEDAPLDTERGYHVMVDNTVGLEVPLLYADRKFAITPMDAGLRLGGTSEFAGLVAAPRPARWSRMAQAARELLPDLDSTMRSTWMGFRPSMPDTLPVISPSARHANVYYAFGHGHIGLTLGARTGSLIADLVARRQAPIDMTPFRIGRFM